MSIGKKVLDFLEIMAKAQTSANAGRILGVWRGIASGVTCEVAAQGDRVALALWRPDGTLLGVAAGVLVVNGAQLFLIDASGRAGAAPQGSLAVIGGGASLELELRDSRCRFRDSFVR